MITYLIICVIILIVFLFYSIIPTIFIRLSGWGIIKKCNGTSGIALTFDDGPNPEYTVQLLDLLKKYNVKATFFVVGSKVERNSDIIKRMSAEGHTLGIHHFHHISSWIMSPFKLKKQLEQTEQSIRLYANEQVLFYRPPWGHFNICTLKQSKKYQIVMWSAIFGDWKIEKCKHSLLDQLRKSSENGSILLLHDCGDTFGADKEAPRYMLQALEIYLRESIKKDIRFITLTDYLKLTTKKRPL